MSKVYQVSIDPITYFQVYFFYNIASIPSFSLSFYVQQKLEVVADGGFEPPVSGL